MKGMKVCLAVLTMFSGNGFAFTLEVSSCEGDFSGTADTPEEAVTFWFCDGGTYCNNFDEIELPSGSGIEQSNFTVQINVDTSYTPTTMEFRKVEGATDSWCIVEVKWERGDNLLGLEGQIFLEGETGPWGCIDGLADGTVAACRDTWRFFNVDGSSDYKYDVRVRACPGTSSTSVQAYFCSNSACDGTIGEEVPVLLEMNDEDGGWTHTEIAAPFNPLAMRLAEMDENWCANKLTFNLFTVLDVVTSPADFDAVVNETAAMIFHNIQDNGMGATPAPIGPTAAPSVPMPQEQVRESFNDESKWLDAAWEITVTVIGTVVVSVAAAAGSYLFGRQLCGSREAMAPSSR